MNGSWTSCSNGNYWHSKGTQFTDLGQVLVQREGGWGLVRDADVDVYRAEVTALRKTLVSGFNCQVILLLRLKSQRFRNGDGAQLWFYGEDVVDVTCKRRFLFFIFY